MKKQAPKQQPSPAPFAWTLSEEGELEITGRGAMPDFPWYGAPWHSKCLNVASVVIGDDITSIGSYAFFDCLELIAATIPAGVTAIGAHAFHQCNSLASLTLPAGLTTIGEWAFCGCTELKTVVLPAGLTAIPGDAFAYCEGLTDVTVPPGVTAIAEDAFEFSPKVILHVQEGSFAHRWAAAHGVAFVPEQSLPDGGAEAASPLSAGDHLTFGRWGGEPIRWRVLAVKDGIATVITEDGIEGRPFHSEPVYPTWEKSTLRAWLNGAFLSAAFTEAERAAIRRTKLYTPSWHRISGGADTADELWLLSREEAAAWFRSNRARRAGLTAHARAQGTSCAEDDGSTEWWLRSPGDHEYNAASLVGYFGEIKGHDFPDELYAVRPAMQLDLSAIQQGQ